MPALSHILENITFNEKKTPTKENNQKDQEEKEEEKEDEMEQTQIIENQKVDKEQEELQTQNKDSMSVQQNQFTIKEAEFKLENQKGQRTVVKLMMKKDFILIQAACCNCFWQIELGLNQAMKIHAIFTINSSIEELFSHILDCFNNKQVSLETLDQLLLLHFTQMVGNRQIEFTITLKQCEVNMHQIIQDLSAQVISLDENNNKQQAKIELLEEKIVIQQEKIVVQEEKIIILEKKIDKLEKEIQLPKAKIALLEEELQKTRIEPVSSILLDDEKDLVYSWISIGKVVSHLNLLYRASAHGFQASQYNWRCDGKGPLICFVQSQNKRRFGGFIHLKYQKNLNKGVAANPNQSFLFSLDDKKQYLSNETSNNYSYYSHINQGFTMGGGHDLYLSDNCYANNSSNSNLSNSYGKNQGGNNTSLAGSSNFVVEEIEVFEVIYKE